MSDQESLTDLCAQEPIRFPAAIQPHGCLMVLDRKGKVLACSANTAERLGLDATLLVGNTLWHAVSRHAAWLSHVHGVIRSLEPGEEHWLSTVDMAGLPWEVRVTTVPWGHLASGSMVMLEWLPGSAFSHDADHRLFESVSRSLRSLNESASLPHYLHDVAAAVQRFTGYERVMVYRFDSDWSGEVVAESTVDGGSSRYLNHRFPASDIPPQARQLYLEQPIRVIPDVDEPPAALLGAADVPAPLSELDLGLSHLRAASPIHLQYLRNMGVRASVVLSLIHRGQLWGMLVCHHHTPRLPPRHMTHALSVASEIILGNVTSHVDSLMALEQTRRALQIHRALSRLERTLEHMGQRFLLDHAAEDLKTTFQADGLSIGLDGEILCGEALPAGLLSRLEQHWTASRELVFETDAIRNRWPDVCPDHWPYAGVLACQMGQESHAWVVMLRHEQVKHVKWAGDPHHPSDSAITQPLTPRASFATWVESVRQQAQPWHAHEIQAILELSRLILLRHKSWELRRHQETLRQFMERQEQYRLKERARMALLVHDQLGQLMAAARMKISALTDAGAQSAKDDLEEAMEMARNLSHHLYPLSLRHGLVTALESLLEDFSHRNDIHFTLDVQGEIPPLKEQVAEVFYGIAREALNNVVKHAQARVAQLILSLQAGELSLMVIDDGRGFPADLLASRRHFGMFGMRERARWIRATFETRNTQQGGAQLSIRWKVSSEMEAA